MAFTDSVAQALTGTDAAANAPTQPPATQPAPTATAPTPPAPQPETTTVPVSTELQAPAPAPAPTGQPRPAMQPAQEQPEAPGEHFRNLSHALKGALLGVVAAGPRHVVDHYETNADGKMMPVMRATGPTDRLRLLAQAALQGLAAGSRVPPQKSRAAGFAAGLGAGFEAQQNQAQQTDLLKRQQSQQEFEQEQKAMTDKAVRAMHNASTFRLWQEAMQQENDHDPERAKNMDIVNSAKDYISRNPNSTLKVDILTPERAKALHDADPNNIAKNTFLPVGFTQAKDENGQLLFEQDGGTPKQVGQIAVISGGKDGDKMPLPQSFIDDLREYGKLAQIGGVDQFKAGQEVPLNAFFTMDSRLNQVKLQEIDGWKENKVGENAVSVNGKLMQRNTVTGKTREYEGAPVAAQKEQAETKRADAETAKLTEETRQLRDWDTNGPDGKGRMDVFGNPVGAPGMDKKEYLKRVDAYTKDYSKDLNQLDAARSQLSDIISNAEKTGKLPGADAVVGIFDAIGISSAPLKGRGFRINNSVVSEHVEGTRNAWQGMALKLSRLTPDGTGQIVSLDQLRDYERIMDAARHDAYVGAANDAVNRGIGIQNAPRGNGRPADGNTIDIFLTLAKGDATKASALLKQYGWTPPAR